MTAVIPTSAIAAFALGAAVSLATSWLLVSRLERVGARIGLSEALLGLLAALAADAPEITASVTALVHHQRTVGAGVVLGSNVFNLAALLGLGAVVATRIELHRKVVVLGGSVALAIAILCLVAVIGLLAPWIALISMLAVFIPYVIVLGMPRRIVEGLRLPSRQGQWIASAVAQEEGELAPAVHPRRGGRRDAIMAAAATVIVVVAGVTMERGASTLGNRYQITEIVLGGLVLAAVTSLPNAVAAIYLARRGRGTAALSTSLNSNAINVMLGLLVPATIVGLDRPAAPGILVVGWYGGLTMVVLLAAYVSRGLGRVTGSLIVLLYLLFVGLLLLLA
jgi:cation:H+ antiporter